jgi:PHD/YefM family antitoxin component YafN of YafNO toxin-antitoxin module
VRKPLDDVTKLRYNMTTKRGKEMFSMSGVISIRPSKDLRNNYAQISKLTRSNPVAITVNGKEDTVVLCHEDFMQQQRQIAEMEAKLSVYAHLAQAADDIRLGRVRDADEAFDELFGELDALEL